MREPVYAGKTMRSQGRGRRLVGPSRRDLALCVVVELSYGSGHRVGIL
jgi:hypothetical protein